ncbi:MAG: cell division protein ZapA [Bacteroidales bacterium]|jgi:cell division protein ZapA|nr:cell division protein ZapA [Bacteroidales bacterium]MEA4967533.1 cell division protein ZapA [Bacteroidaceae bacterium]NCC17490.1 cell division protein ZapA [Bacteroidia bacterium]MDD2576336.1 cell division protein ZapA [Bacteroidales bacterium]MDD3286085.1 cell division protein ZapA [Bacteroidales bacterium]
MTEDILISVDIAGRIYKVRVKRDEEEVFRNAVETVKTNIKEYANIYAYKDKQDLLAMVLLQYVTSYMKIKDDNLFCNKQLIEKLEEINSIL